MTARENAIYTFEVKTTSVYYNKSIPILSVYKYRFPSVAARETLCLIAFSIGVSGGKHTLHRRCFDVFFIIRRCQRAKTLFVYSRLRPPSYINSVFPRCQRWKTYIPISKLNAYLAFDVTFRRQAEGKSTC